MPAESSATAVILVAIVAALLFLPFLLLVLAPFLGVKLLLRPRTPTYHRGGYHGIP